MQGKIEKIQNELEQLSAKDLQIVLDLVDSTLEKKKEENKAEKREERLIENIEEVTVKWLASGEIRNVENKKKSFIHNNNILYSIFDKSFHHKKNSNYLLTLLNRNLAWAKPGQHRITYFLYQVDSPTEIEINNVRYKVLFKTRFKPEHTNSNLQIDLKIKSLEYPVCKISAWFDLKELEIIDLNIIDGDALKLIESTYGYKYIESLKSMEKWTENNKEDFDKKIIECLVNPKYKKKSSGEKAITFLNENKVYDLKLGKIMDKPILIFELRQKYF